MLSLTSEEEDLKTDQGQALLLPEERKRPNGEPRPRVNMG